MILQTTRLLLIGLLSFHPIANAKVVNDKLKLRMNFDDLANYTPGRQVMMDGLHYITHFACAIGQCTWEIRIKAVHPARALNRANSNRDYVVDESLFNPIQNYGIWRYFDNPDESTLPTLGRAPVNLRVILDSEWNDKDLSKSSFGTKMAGKECMGNIRSKLTREIFVPLDGQWSKWVNGALLQKAKPHHWYFVLEDCQGNFLSKFTEAVGIKPHAFLPHVQFEYEMKLLNVDGSHFGFEYWGVPSFTLVTGILATSGAVYFIFKQYSIVTKSQKIHPIVQSVNIALITMVFYLWSHWFHLTTFKGDGIGLPTLDSFAHLARSLGNIGLMICVFAVALGSSLNVDDMTIPGEAFIALSACYGFVLPAHLLRLPSGLWNSF
eukprot:GHVH01004678.1.p1 GENE.GHVH01004678.1~~GHVH01004678.1.p1  ORF type:complete len:380 (+),score=46.60 GHVH01004678.1:118-1257(+)